MTEIKQIEKVQTSVKPVRPSKKVKKVKISFPVQIILVVALVVLGIISWNSTRGANIIIEQRSAAAKEAARPANLEIIIISDKSCTDCTSLADYIDVIKSQDVKIVKQDSLDINDSRAQELIKKYNIEKIPFLVVTGEINKHDDVQALWSAWGIIQDKTFVLTNIIPPYSNLATGKVEGRVSITYLTVDSCDECYDVKVNQNVLQNSYGIRLVGEKTIDVDSQEGNDFIEKYNITKVPTFMIDNEVAVYQGLLSVWSNVGTIEADGAYIFRGAEQMGTYYDLETKEVVEPASSTSANQSSQ